MKTDDQHRNDSRHCRLIAMTSTSTRDLVSQPYKYGFVTEIETDKIAKGLSEDVVRLISARRRLSPTSCSSSG